MITPLLSMSLPDPGVTPGPNYANLYNAAMLVVDGIVGAGTTPAQMNINSYLDFQRNDAVNLRSVRLFYTGTLSAPTDVNCLYNLSGNLYFIDNAGNQIQVTNNGALNTGVSGNIGGLAGTSASVSFNSVANAYTFNATPSKLASINAMTGVFGAVVCSGTLTAAVASFTSASYGNIQTLTGSLVQATTISGGTGNFGTSNITTLTNATLNGTNAAFTQLTSSGGKITALTATALTATNGTITTLTSSGANLGPVVATTMAATQGTITQLTSSGANLGPVVATTINGSSTVTAPTATVTTANLTTINSTGTSTLGVVSASQATVQSATTLSGTTTLGFGSNKVVVTPSTPGSQLSCSGDIVAAGGFRQQVGPAIYYNSSNVIAGTYNLNIATLPTTSGLQFQWIAPTSGSLVSVQVAYVLPSAITYTLLVNKNASETAFTSYAIASPTNLVGYVQAFTKDSLTFVPGDLLNMQVQTNATGFLGVHAWLTVEC
jgi:hypothetical protein